jgi:hypothetical protein
VVVGVVSISSSNSRGAIPVVCEAEPGVLTYLDLPPHGARGLL